MNRKQRRMQQKQRGASPDTAASSLQRLLTEGLDHHRAGRLLEAERIYRQVIAEDARQPDALHLLGVIAYQVGRHDAAVDLIRRAIALRGDDPNYHAHLGVALRNLGRLDEALASYDRSIALRPNDAETHHNRGVALQAQGKPDDAVAAYDRALALRQDYVEAWNNRGSTLSGQGKFDEALASFDRALAVKADNPDVLNNRGIALMGQGKPVEAVACYDRALALRPDYVDAHNNRGTALRVQGEFVEAIASYDRALAANPQFAVAHNNRGLALASQGRLDEALTSYDQAVALKLESAEVHRNRGDVRREQGRLAEALACYERALAIKGDDLEALVRRGDTLSDLGQLEEAAASYDRALALKPDDADIHASRGVALAGQGKLAAATSSFDKALALEPGTLRHAWLSTLWLPVIPASTAALAAARTRYRDAVGALRQFPGSLPSLDKTSLPPAFYLAAHDLDDLETLSALCRLYREKAPQLGFAASHIGSWQPPAGERRLRIGFLSEFLGDHAIGRLHRGLVRHLDRSRFEVIVIQAPRTAGDVDAALADKVLKLPPTLAAQQQAVAGETLDVLFYPEIGISQDAYRLAYARLAPVQAVGWGHPDTTGLDSIDYFVSAGSIEPADADRHYGERLIRLGRLPCFYEAPDALREVPARAAFGLPASGTLYGCPQSLFALHPDFDSILAEIAAGDPQGHLVVLDGEQPGWSSLLRGRWAQSHHSLLERVHFLPRQRHDRFMALMAHFDVLLDPIHLGSANTLYEAMVYGTPIVTWPGRFMRGRIVAGAYHQMGIADAPVAARLEDYAPLALALGRDPARREALRRAARAKADDLFSDRRVVRQFEAFLEAAVAAAGRREKLPPGWQPGST
ncbi:MAG: tetratricopeptide repeat protein [Reyranellaceae bacterium]